MRGAVGQTATDPVATFAGEGELARIMARTLDIVPIYKKKAVFSAGNDRGVHLTAQLSKVAERLMLPMLETHISLTVAFGPNQFAYMKGRGARDALAFLVVSWILALQQRKKVGVYCSDVSRAFDSVRAERLTPVQRKSPGLGQSGGVLVAATNRSGGRGRPTIGQDAPQKHGVPGHRAWTHTLEPVL